ncbi:MAG TPA: 1-deoxy-D-xylulose-5-phosphate reductoisomerase [Spirochaetales bacterium]|nr:1-deoxy-D-xylulose-5-phosphate reductoisomerase [Spirochaetales bacterium]
MKSVLVVGASGSIGKQTLDVLERHKDLFTLAGMSAHTNLDFLIAAANSLNPDAPLCLSAPTVCKHDRVSYYGKDGLVSMIMETQADIVVNAAAGSDGLAVSVAALRSGKHLALANKETVVMAGRLVLAMAKQNGLMVLPVDSEHSALFNLIERFGKASIREVIITASGGAFRNCPLEELPNKTLNDALAHPTWNMGAKITIDSATMANKGLEVIEAARLFDLNAEQIKVVIHPESKVHSFVRTLDGSLYAQISRPDMRLPILNALTWPHLAHETVGDLDITSSALNFGPVQEARYPLLALAYEALVSGEGACCAYNAANEIAVGAFMNARIGFSTIAAVVERTLRNPWPKQLEHFDEVFACDEAARNAARIGITL